MPDRSQTHQFSCAGCGQANAVQVPAKCGCHECEERTWRNSSHKTHQTWAKVCFGVVVTAALMVLGMYVSSDVRDHADTVALHKERNEQALIMRRLEIEKINALKGLNLDAYKVQTGITEDGKLYISLVSKERSMKGR